jgi:hypothetical protein
MYLSELRVRISQFGEFFWRVVLSVHGVDLVVINVGMIGFCGKSSKEAGSYRRLELTDDRQYLGFLIAWVC